jgi:serine/threonine protein kinase
MAENDKQQPRYQERLDELLDRWDELVQLGRTPQPTELCRDCPEMIFPLTQAIQQLQQMDGLLEATTDEPTPAPLPEKIGPFEVVSELGRGGMGVVYCCRQKGTNRQIAVKVLRPVAESEDDSGRFRREMLSAGAITDPGVVHIYDAGVDETGPIRWRWIAMERIDGIHLDRYVVQHQLSRPQIIAVFRQICESVSALHQKGIIHQDLKPSNILVDTAGRPQIVDFGIAAAIDPEGEIQLQNSPLTFGTLPYLPPESLDGGDGTIDVRTDVYSLGIILFELLTNNSMRQWHETTKVHMGAADCESRSQWITFETHSLPYDLRHIVRKAVRSNRNQRYTSVDALSAELKRFLDGFPIEASPAGPFRRVTKWCIRNRVLAAAVLIGILILVGWTLTVRSWQDKSDADSWTLANGRAQLEQGRRRLARGLENQEYVKLLAYVDTDPQHAALRLSNFKFPETRRSLARKLLSNRAQWQELQIDNTPRDITELSLSKDQNSLVAHSQQHGILVYQLSPSIRPSYRSNISDTSFLGSSPDDQNHLLSDLNGGRIHVILGTDHHRFDTEHIGDVKCGDISPDGTAVALGLANGDIVIVTPDGHIERRWTGNHQRPVWLRWEKTTEIVTCTPAGTFRILNPETMTNRIDIALQESFPEVRQLNQFDYSAGMDFGACMLLAQRTRFAFSYHPHRQPPLVRYPFQGFDPLDVRLVPPRSLLIATSSTITVANVYSREPLWSLQKLDGDILAIDVSADGDRFALASTAGHIRIYRTHPRPWGNDTFIHDEHGMVTAVSSVAAQGHANPILVGRNDGRVSVWDAVSGSVLHSFQVGTKPITNITAFRLPDGNYVVCTGTARKTRILQSDFANSDTWRTLWQVDVRSHAARFAPDGTVCLVGCHDGTLLRIDLLTGQAESLTGHAANVRAICFDPVHRRWLTGDDDGMLQFRDWTGKPIVCFRAHKKRITGIAVLQDRILTASRDQALSEWSLTGELVQERVEHRAAITSMAVSSNRESLATGDRVGRICLWDPQTLDLRLTISESTHAISKLHFLKDDCLISGSNDEPFLRIW